MGSDRVEALSAGDEAAIEIWMDHKNLEYFMTERKLNHQQAR